MMIMDGNGNCLIHIPHKDDWATSCDRMGLGTRLGRAVYETALGLWLYILLASFLSFSSLTSSFMSIISFSPFHTLMSSIQLSAIASLGMEEVHIYLAVAWSDSVVRIVTTNPIIFLKYTFWESAGHQWLFIDMGCNKNMDRYWSFS
jgi:hypothetical protein